MIVTEVLILSVLLQKLDFQTTNIKPLIRDSNLECSPTKTLTFENIIIFCSSIVLGLLKISGKNKEEIEPARTMAEKQLTAVGFEPTPFRTRA